MLRLRALLTTAALAASAVIALAADVSLPELFARAKGEFGSGNFKESLADFELLDATSRKAGFEADRAKLAPVILFYRGANLAALGRRDEAKEVFISYLSYMPSASIATPPFPKDVVDAFNLARKEGAGKINTVEAAYFRFVPLPGWTLAADEKWAESPVRYLLSAEQKKQYAALTTPAAREAFVASFWSALDPTPGTPQNEFQAEFERRVAFADANFATEKNPGRATERGAVFTFLGPPTFVAVSQVAAGEDVMGALRGGGNSDIGRAARGSNSTNLGSMTGARPSDNLETDSRLPMRESWTYRQNRLPIGVIFKEVRFDFITKEGYGSGVMQKDPEPMQTLGQAVEAARREKKLK